MCVYVCVCVCVCVQVYVHRSGRTGRGEEEGLSVLLVAPEDTLAYRNICKSLNRGVRLHVCVCVHVILCLCVCLLSLSAHAQRGLQ